MPFVQCSLQYTHGELTILHGATHVTLKVLMYQENIAHLWKASQSVMSISHLNSNLFTVCVLLI